MKNDYNQMMKEEILKLTTTPTLLFHVCCAPCSSACFDRLSAFDITLYYFNPNTYPKDEYILRAKQFSKLTQLPLVVEEYDHNQFLSVIKGCENDIEGGERCKKCIKNRLIHSFEYAKNNGFDYVTTTLTISPHKDANFINQKGKELEKTYKVKFLPSDFKKENGFINSINISKQLNLYRQDYCGCEFSFRSNNNDEIN